MDTYISTEERNSIPEHEVGLIVARWLKNTRTPREIHIKPVEQLCAHAGKVEEPLYDIHFTSAELCPG